jgi:hypothetical protein
VNRDEIDELCAALHEVVHSKKGEVPILARALRWINARAETVGEIRLCCVVVSWTLAVGRPMSGIAFDQLVAGVGFSSTRYDRQRVRVWLDQAVKTGLIRRVSSRGGRGRAALYRLAFVDEILIELQDDALLLRLQALDGKTANLQGELPQVLSPEKLAAASAAGIQPETSGSGDGETSGGFDPKLAAASAAHRNRSHLSKDRSDGSHKRDDENGQDDGRRSSLEAIQQAKDQLSADPRIGWMAKVEADALDNQETEQLVDFDSADPDVAGEDEPDFDEAPAPDESGRPEDDEPIEAEMVEVAS